MNEMEEHYIKYRLNRNSMDYLVNLSKFYDFKNELVQLAKQDDAEDLVGQLASTASLHFLLRDVLIEFFAIDEGENQVLEHIFKRRFYAKFLASRKKGEHRSILMALEKKNIESIGIELMINDIDRFFDSIAFIYTIESKMIPLILSAYQAILMSQYKITLKEIKKYIESTNSIFKYKNQ